MNWYLVRAERMAEPSATYVYNLGDKIVPTDIRGDDAGGLVMHFSKTDQPLEGDSLALIDWSQFQNPI